MPKFVIFARTSVNTPQFLRNMRMVFALQKSIITSYHIFLTFMYRQRTLVVLKLNTKLTMSIYFITTLNDICYYIL